MKFMHQQMLHCDSRYCRIEQALQPVAVSSDFLQRLHKKPS